MHTRVYEVQKGPKIQKKIFNSLTKDQDYIIEIKKWFTVFVLQISLSPTVD